MSEDCTPPALLESATKALEGIIPKKSKTTYDKALERFETWLDKQGTARISEHTILPYFQELLKDKKPTTAWTEYSCLKKMIRVRHSVDISKFYSISDLLKQASKGHSKKKAKTFTSEQVDQFLEKAPNSLDVIQDKLALLLGLFGGLRSEEFCDIQFENIQVFEDHLKVSIGKRKTDQAGVGTTFFAIASAEKFR